MAFTDPLSLENAFDSANLFVRTQQDSTGSQWIDSSSTVAEPRRLMIKHQSTGKGIDAVDRHLVQLSATKLDAENVPRTAVVNMTISVPRQTVITSTIVYNLVANAINVLTAGQLGSLETVMTVTNLDKLFRGEQ